MFFFVLATYVAGLLITSSVGEGGDFVERAQRIAASERLYRIGLSFSLVGSLSTILLAVGLYVTVKPVDENLAIMALSFRLAESAIGGVGAVMSFARLQIYLPASDASPFDANQLGALAAMSSLSPNVAAIFFSLGSTIFFYVFLKSNYIPKLLSIWSVVASLLYAAVWFVDLILPQYRWIITYGSVPILIAELAAGLWLSIAGIKTRPFASSAVPSTP